MQTLFKKFNIVSVLKKTEYSSVYLADHIFLEKRIILKTLDSSKIIDKTDLQRFKSEAKILAKLNHPNIIRVLDFGTFENFVYISFEYFPGQTLRETMNSVKLNPNQKTVLLKQIATGLSYAHINNIIHRDIKPENILVDDNHHLKIADFGLALSDESQALTNPESMMGTPAYASPEQVSGAVLTAASDLFALGLISCELFNNQNPIMGKDITQTVNNILNWDQAQLDRLLAGTHENEKGILKSLLQPDPLLRKIPENFLENDTFVVAARLPLNVKVLWGLVGFAIISVVIYYFSYGSYSPSETQDQLLMDTTTTADRVMLNDPIEESVSYEQQNRSERDKKAAVEEVQSYAYLQVKAKPAAMLYINSIEYGNTTEQGQIELADGIYKLVLKNDNFPDYEQDIELKVGEKKDLNIDLAKFSGILKVFTYPWAVVEINGTGYGQTPLDEPIRLKKGNYIMQLKNPGFETYKKDITITGADTIIIQHNFVNPGFGTIID